MHLAREDEDGDAGDDPECRADGKEGIEAPVVPLDLLCCRQAVPEMGEQGSDRLNFAMQYNRSVTVLACASVGFGPAGRWTRRSCSRI